MMIKRFLIDPLVNNLKANNKIAVIYGARQTGKTTLCNEVIKKLGLRTLSINADQRKYIDILSSRDLNKLSSLIEGYELLFIDEAQRIPEIGINLKILHDYHKDLKIMITGSSSIDIASAVNESLTGRKRVYELFPLSVNELHFQFNKFEINEFLENNLVYGSYPEVFAENSYEEKRNVLEEICNSYLFKDIFELTDIKYKNKLIDLLKLLAFQIGSEVSINELSQNLRISREAVDNYLVLLEQSFVIYKLKGYSKDLRKEISKLDKIYFYDLGLRNMLINNFNLLNMRDDIGQLWENFIIAEKLKKIKYLKSLESQYFWRTYTGAELDYIEEKDGKLQAFEIKYKKQKIKIPKTFIETYPGSIINIINKENYLDFLL